MRTNPRQRSLTAFRVLFAGLLAACVTPAQVASFISTGASVVCPDLVAIPSGPVVCSAVATIVEEFIELYEVVNPTMKTAIANSTTATPMVRVGSYGFAPATVAAVLMAPATAKQLDSYVAVRLLGETKASAARLVH